MSKFNNGKNTSSVIFYNRGVPNTFRNFGKWATTNYAMLKQIIRNNKQNGRPMFSFIL